MNKYSVSYQVFDGVELLEDSINHVNKFVSHISIILQTTSYWDTILTEEEINIVKDLKERNLVNDLVIINNDKRLSKVSFQTQKRNIGRELAIQNDCTHYMSMDCDEFYTDKDFSKMIEYHNNNTEHVSYMPIWDYYKDSKYLIESNDSPENALKRMYVNGFQPVKYPLTFNYPLPLRVDPTRKPNVPMEKVKRWDVDEIKMHHMCYVRANIYKKVYNACAKSGYGNKLEHFKYLTECYDNYEITKKAVGAVGRVYNIIEIEPIIKLDKYYDNLEKLK